MQMTKFLRSTGGVLFANIGTVLLMVILSGSLSLNVWLGRPE